MNPKPYRDPNRPVLTLDPQLQPFIDRTVADVPSVPSLHGNEPGVTLISPSEAVARLVKRAGEYLSAFSQPVSGRPDPKAIREAVNNFTDTDRAARGALAHDQETLSAQEFALKHGITEAQYAGLSSVLDHLERTADALDYASRYTSQQIDARDGTIRMPSHEVRWEQARQQWEETAEAIRSGPFGAVAYLIARFSSDDPKTQHDFAVLGANADAVLLSLDPRAGQEAAGRIEVRATREAPRFTRSAEEAAERYIESSGGKLADKDGALAGIFRRARDPENARTGAPEHELHVSRRSAAAELGDINHLLRDPSVQRVEVVPSRAGQKTNDFDITWSDGSRSRWETTTMTSAPAGRLPRESEGTRNPLVAETSKRIPATPERRQADIAEAITRKVDRGQLSAVRPDGMPAGGVLSIHAPFANSTRQDTDRAMELAKEQLKGHPEVHGVVIWRMERDAQKGLSRIGELYLRDPKTDTYFHQETMGATRGDAGRDQHSIRETRKTRDHGRMAEVRVPDSVALHGNTAETAQRNANTQPRA